MNAVVQIPSQLSSHLRAFRKAKKLSQTDLGIRLGLSQARIARIEGDPLSISVEQLLRVLAVLDVRVVLEPVPPANDPVAAPRPARRSGTAAATTGKALASTRNGDW